jgi:3-deoxy-D-manno-octulosonic-acid transferase
VHYIETWATSHKVPSSRLSSGATAADLIIVDSVGVLARLYSRATVAYVGGGFHRAGLHSVLEPAAFGVPVLFGPRHTGSRDAGLLLAAGGGFIVRSPTEFRARLHANEQAGEAARETVRQGLGAARRSLALVDRLMVGRE